MSSKAVQYFSSKKFKKDMEKVGSKSVSFGVSTPSETVYEEVEKAAKVKKQQPEET
jgi:hypothetical protein